MTIQKEIEEIKKEIEKIKKINDENPKVKDISVQKIENFLERELEYQIPSRRIK